MEPQWALGWLNEVTFVDHIDQIAADLAARERPTVELDVADPAIDRRHQHPVDIGRELDLGPHAQVSGRRAVDEADEQMTAVSNYTLHPRRVEGPDGARLGQRRDGQHAVVEL